jgi:hypothetical protein
MRVILILIVFTLLTSCQRLQEKKHNDFVLKVLDIGINKLKNIEFGTRGELELYQYSLTKDSSIFWYYNRKTKTFDYPNVLQDFKINLVDFQSYIVDLRNKIQSLNILMINNPWQGNILRFRISNNEIIEYVNPEFKFDDRFKNEWLKEIRTGQKLKDNWYYIKIKK